MHFIMATLMIFILMAFVGLVDGETWTVREDPSEQTAAFAAEFSEATNS